MSIPRANLVYDADYPVCRLKSFASGPPGLPGFLQELVFFVSHPGGLLAEDSRGSSFLRANMVLGSDSPVNLQKSAARGPAGLPGFQHALTVDDAHPDDLREDALSGSVELPHVVRNEVAFLVCPPTPAAGTSCDADRGHSHGTCLPHHPVGHETAAGLGASSTDLRQVTCEEESPMPASSTGQRVITYNLNGIPSEIPSAELSDASTVDSDVIWGDPMSPTPTAISGCSRSAPPTDSEVPEKGFLNMWDNPARFTLRGWVPLYIPDATDASVNGPFLRTSAVHIGDTW